MARSYSKFYKSTISRVSANEAPLILLEIYHPDLEQPVRVVNDTQDLISNGKTFIACAFRVTLPADQERTIPKATLAVDNVGRDLMYWIERSAGGRGAKATFMQVMRSRPDLIEWQTMMNLENVDCTFETVTGQLGYTDIYQRPAIAMQYRPDTSPGVF